MKVYCNNCKKPLDEGDRFCRHCGSSDIVREEDVREEDVKPMFEIEGDVLRKYNPSPEYHGGTSSWSVNAVLPHILLDLGFGDHWPTDIFGEDYFPGFGRYLKNDIPDKNDLERLGRWKKETSIAIPSNVRKIEGRGRDRVFGDDLIYSLRMPSSVTKIEKGAFSVGSFIGFLNVPPSLISPEGCLPNGLANVHELKIEEGCEKLWLGEVPCHVHRLILPKSLKVINNQHLNYYYERIDEMTIPFGVTELNPTVFACLQYYGSAKCNYEGSKYRFKSICKITRIHYYFRDHEWLSCTVHCSDGDLHFAIHRKKLLPMFPKEDLEIVFKD